MTTGRPGPLLWRYALPLMLGNWLQRASTAVESLIAGRFIGQEALAAEGIAGPVMNLVILAISGLCIGAGVLMSESFGAKDQPRLRSVLATTLLFGAGLCCAVAALGVLKAVGAAKTPVKFLAFPALLNAGLDLVVIGGVGFGIVCSALTTVAAEGASAALAWWYLTARVKPLCPDRWRIDRALLGDILRYGSVTALQQAIQPIGKVLIQGQVNALGVSSIAAFNAVTRVDDFAFTPEQSIAQGITTYVAQNRGAGRPERIRQGFAAGLRLEAGYWLVLGSAVLLTRRGLLSLFVTGEGAAQVVALGSGYLGLMAAFYLLPAMTNGFQGFYRGMGRLRITLLGTFVQTSLRVIGTVLLAPRMGLPGIAFACAAGWSAMLAFEIPLYLCKFRKK